MIEKNHGLYRFIHSYPQITHSYPLLCGKVCGKHEHNRRITQKEKTEKNPVSCQKERNRRLFGG